MLKAIPSLLVSAAAIAWALPAQAMTAAQKVEVEREVTQEDGRVEIITAPPSTVVPGDMLVYTVDYFNDKTEVTDNFRIDMPIPSEITYLEGSAQRENAVILYSVDKGASFKQRENLLINLAEGGTRPASAEDITHIRWTLTETVNPGDRGKMSFKGRLK
jgi:hypothetical protein